MKFFCIKAFLITRIFYIIFIQLIFETHLVRKRDLSTEIIVTINQENMTKIEKLLLKILKSFISYDGLQFEFISKNGYISDHIFCFYPLFPYFSKSFIPFFKLFDFKNENTSFILSGIIFNNILSLLNSIILCNLINDLTGSKEKGKISVLLFLINPGTIFYMAYYSENLYFFLSLLLIKELINDKYNLFYYVKLSIIIFCLLMTRSNGLILLSFFIIPIFKILFDKINQKDNMFLTNNTLENIKFFFCLIFNNLLFILLHVLLCFFGLVIFYWMINLRPKKAICNYINQLINFNYYRFTDYWNYCNNLNSPIKTIYNYLQKSYWNVAFLSQYKLTNIDKILYSIPMHIIGLYLIYKSLKEFNFKSLLNFNLYEFFYTEKSKKNIIEVTFILGGLINFFVLFITVLFIAYISINNRLYTSHPLLYYWLSDDVLKYLKGENKKGFLILLYFFSFSLLYFITNIGGYNGI